MIFIIYAMEDTKLPKGAIIKYGSKYLQKQVFNVDKLDVKLWIPRSKWD